MGYGMNIQGAYPSAAVRKISPGTALFQRIGWLNKPFALFSERCQDNSLPVRKGLREDLPQGRVGSACKPPAQGRVTENRTWLLYGQRGKSGEKILFCRYEPIPVCSKVLHCEVFQVLQQQGIHPSIHFDGVEAVRITHFAQAFCVVRLKPLPHDAKAGRVEDRPVFKGKGAPWQGPETVQAEDSLNEKTPAPCHGINKRRAYIERSSSYNGCCQIFPQRCPSLSGGMSSLVKECSAGIQRNKGTPVCQMNENVLLYLLRLRLRLRLR